MVKKFNNKFRIESSRMYNWDYRSPGVYFVTICTDADVHWFGNIQNGKFKLSQIGQIANSYWKDISIHHHLVQIDEYVIMTNHIHGLLAISASEDYYIRKGPRAVRRDVAGNVPTR